MPSFHHSVAVLPLPFRRSAVVKFRYCVKITYKKIPFRYSRKQQKDTQRQLQRQQCTETATANGNGKTATEERQRNCGNQALVLSHFALWHRSNQWRGQALKSGWAQRVWGTEVLQWGPGAEQRWGSGSEAPRSQI